MEKPIFEDPKIRKKDLKLLSVGGLINTLRGNHNVILLSDLWNNLNADEIISIYHGTGACKNQSSIKYRGMPRKFYELINELNKISYPYIGNFRKDCIKKFPSGKGDLEKRLLNMDEYTKDAFILSFHKPYIPSEIESPEHPEAWSDDPGGRNKQIYINRVYDALYEGVTKE